MGHLVDGGRAARTFHALLDRRLAPAGGVRILGKPLGSSARRRKKEREARGPPEIRLAPEDDRLWRVPGKAGRTQANAKPNLTQHLKLRALTI